MSTNASTTTTIGHSTAAMHRVLRALQQYPGWYLRYSVGKWWIATTEGYAVASGTWANIVTELKADNHIQ